jgi:hypothetical protein
VEPRFPRKIVSVNSTAYSSNLHREFSLGPNHFQKRRGAELSVLPTPFSYSFLRLWRTILFLEWFGLSPLCIGSASEVF